MVQAYIDRINSVNPSLNCVVQERFEQALQEARLVDVQLSSSEKTEEQLRVQTPLLGVPISIKESIAVQGMDPSCQPIPQITYLLVYSYENLDLL